MALQPDGGTGQGVLTLAGWAGLAGQAGLAGLGWAGWGEISDLMGSRRMYLDPSGTCYLLHGSSILRKNHVFMISGSSYLLGNIAIQPVDFCCVWARPGIPRRAGLGGDFVISGAHNQ